MITTEMVITLNEKITLKLFKRGGYSSSQKNINIVEEMTE